MHAAPHATHEATGTYRIQRYRPNVSFYIVICPDGTEYPYMGPLTRAIAERDRLNAEDRERRKDDGTR